MSDIKNDTTQPAANADCPQSECSTKSHPVKFARSLLRMVQDSLQDIEDRKDWPHIDESKAYQKGRKSNLEFMEREIKSRAEFYGIDI